MLHQSDRPVRPIREIPVYGIGAVAVEPWLLNYINYQNTSPVAMDRIISAGMFTRLWVPTHGEFCCGDIRNWTKKIDDQTWSDIELLAILSVSDLNRWLAIPRSDELVDFEALTAGVAELRNELESICCILRIAGKGAILQAALDASDEIAKSEPQLLTDLKVVGQGDEFLHAVAWIEPDAWWGVLRGP